MHSELHRNVTQMGMQEMHSKAEIAIGELGLRAKISFKINLQLKMAAHIHCNRHKKPILITKSIYSNELVSESRSVLGRRPH